jgi:hypothetical protein
MIVLYCMSSALSVVQMRKALRERRDMRKWKDSCSYVRLRCMNEMKMEWAWLRARAERKVGDERRRRADSANARLLQIIFLNLPLLCVSICS